MSSKPGPQSSDIRDAMVRAQSAKASRTKADQKLKRSIQALDDAKAELARAETEVKDADAALAAAVKRGMAAAMKDGDATMALASIVAGAMDGGQPAGRQSPAGDDSGQLPLA